MAVDPRTSRRGPKTVNEEIRDRGIRHAIQLEKLKSYEAAKIVDFLTLQVIPELEDIIDARLRLIDERGFDLGPETTMRLQQMLDTLAESVRAWTSGLANSILGTTSDIAQHEAEWNAGVINDALPPAVAVTVETVVPSVALLEAAIASSPIDGVLLAEIVERLGRKTSEALEAELRKGIAIGETTPQIVARVQKVTGLVKSSAEAVTRTAVGHASSVARQATYKANSDIIKGYMVLATLDTRTCAQCQALDGKVVPVEGGIKPPFHLNCRCTTTAIVKSLKELGYNVKEMPPGTRASMNGQVPLSLRYGDWLETQSAAIQDEALGPARGKLFRTGKLKVGDFVDARGDQIDLGELKRRDPAAFKAAGL